MNHWYSTLTSKIASFVAVFFLLILPTSSFSQLVVTPGGTAQALINALAGTGVTISNVTLNCNPLAYGTFDGSASNIGLQNGVILTSGNAANAVGPNNAASVTGSFGTTFNDPQLMTVDPGAVNDVCILEFDIVVRCNYLEMRF